MNGSVSVRITSGSQFPAVTSSTIRLLLNVWRMTTCSWTHRPPIPVGPNKGNTTIAIDIINSPPVVTAGTEGWVYNSKTGEIIANCDDANMAGTRAYDEY